MEKFLSHVRELDLKPVGESKVFILEVIRFIFGRIALAVPWRIA